MKLTTWVLIIIGFLDVCWSVRFSDVTESKDFDEEAEDIAQLEANSVEESGTLGSGMENLRRLIQTQAKLLTHSDSTGPVPLANLSKHKILFVTVETRKRDPLHLIGSTGWDYEVHNIGAGKPFNGNGDIIKYMNEWIATVPDDQLVVYMDGKDVMYGGCDLEDFIQRFRTLSTATGAPIIFGAEYSCFQAPTAGCDEYPVHFRDKVLDTIGLNKSTLDSWGVSKEAKAELKYLNAGVHMGRAKDLRRLYRQWYRISAGKRLNQDGAAQTFQDHPELVGLDYATLLISNLFNVRLEKGGKALYHYDEATKQWMNAVTGKSVCFFHGNGAGKWTLGRMVTHFSNDIMDYPM